jgi:uncharacterized protein (TIGR00297 family)
LLACVSSTSGPYLWAFITSLAAALADTLESEIGTLSRRQPRLITTLKRVPRGTDGAISPLGTLSGLAGALSIAMLALAVGLLPANSVISLALVAVGATLLESFLGAWLERRRLLDNETVNFLNTLAAAVLGAILWWLP